MENAEPEDFEIDINTDASPAVVSVRGEVDIHTAPRLRERLLEVADHNAGRAVLDLTSVGFMDSTGVGVVVGVLKRFRSHSGGDLLLRLPEGRARRRFEIMGLDKIFTIER